jgi:O-antigen/teichoic acid export membrane protein
MSLQSNREVTREVTKNATALFVGKLLVMSLSLVFVLSAARLLGVSGFGRYALIRTYFDLLLSISTTGLGLLVTREIAKSPLSAPVYVGTAAPLVIGTAVLISGSLMFASPMLGYGPDFRAMLWLACLALVPASFAFLSESVFVAIGKAKYVMYGTLGEALLYTSSGLVLLWAGHGPRSLFLALVGTRTCLAGVYTLLLRRQFGEAFRRSSWGFVKQLCRDWRVFALETWTVSITAGINTIVLSLFHREAAIGLYAAASRITAFGAPLAASFTGAMFPYMSRLYRDSAEVFRRVTEESVKYMLAVALPGVVIVAIFADRVILTLYGNAYEGAVPVLRIGIWVFALHFVNHFMSHLLFARGEPTKSLRVAIVTFFALLLLSVGLIPRWGAVGAAWAALGSTAVASCFYFVFAFKTGPKRVLITFGRTSVAAASLAAFLVLGRQAHPGALAVGALGVYLGALVIMRVSSPRELGAFFRGSQ